MAQHDGHLELWLPALTWVNSDAMKNLGALEWTLDFRPTDYLIRTMPRYPTLPPATPKVSPYARRPNHQAAPTSTTTSPRLTSTPRSTSLLRTASSSTRIGSSGTNLVSSRPTSFALRDEEDLDLDSVPTIRHRSDVYLYFDEPRVHQDHAKGEISKVYPCLHCPAECSIAGRPNSNLHKHRRVCPGLPAAWFRRAPGSIPPDEDPAIAAARKKELRTLLIGAVISKNLPFSIFEGDLMQAALRAISPSFYWPGRSGIKADAEGLFLDLERQLIDEIAKVPGSVSTATDTWTSPDYSHTYMAINGFFFNADGKFCRRLVAFKGPPMYLFVHILPGFNQGGTWVETTNYPRRKDASFVSTSGDSRTSLNRPEKSITINSDDDSNYNANEDQEESKGEKDQSLSPTPAPTTTNSKSNQKKKQATKKRKKTSSVQLQNKKSRAPAVKNFVHPDDVDVDQVTEDEGDSTGFRKTTNDEVKALLSYYKDPEYVPGEEVSP